MANCLQNPWWRLALSITAFFLIIGFDLLTRRPLYDWSVTHIPLVEANAGNWLKVICSLLVPLGGQLPNLIVIGVFTAMFKRRHQAFSYLFLWNC